MTNKLNCLSMLAETIAQMGKRELERRLAELNVREEDCEVIFLVHTIVDPPDYEGHTTKGGGNEKQGS